SSWRTAGGDLLEEPAQRTTTVTLAESGTPGTYTGTFPLVDVAAVTSISGTVDDAAQGGTSTTAARSAARLPITVAGSVEVELDAPDGTFVGSRLSVWSSTVAFGGQEPIEAGDTVTLDLVPGEGYGITLFDGAGRHVSGFGGLAVQAGRTQRHTLTPPVVVQVRLEITDQQTLDPMPHRSFTVYDEEGVPVGWGTTDEDGRATFDVEGEQTIRIVPHIGWDEAYDRTAVLTVDVPETGPHSANVIMTGPERATVRGHVTDNIGGTPKDAVGATVTVSQRVGDRWVSRSAMTDANGDYSIDAYEGEDATVKVQFRNGSASVDLDLEGTVEQDFEIVRPMSFDILVELYTLTRGSVEPSIVNEGRIHWRDAVHYGLRVETPGAGSGGYVSVRDGIATVEGNPGDVVTVSASGSEAGLQPDSATFALSADDLTPSVALTLREGPAATVPLQRADGTPFTGYWQINAFEVDGSGRTRVASQSGFGSTGTIDLKDEGDHQLEIFSIDDPRVRATVSADIEPDVVNTLPAVQLRTAGWFSSTANNVTPLQRDVAAGGTAEIRASFRNDGSSAVTGAVLELDVPAGTTVAPGGVVRDGVTTTTTDLGGGRVGVTIGSIAPGASGVVRYYLQTTGVAPGSTLRPTAQMRFTGSGSTRVEPIVASPLRVEGVTLSAPATLGSRSTTLSGRAPAGWIVDVLADGAVLGTVTASPGGFWRLATTLPDRHGAWDHSVWATAQATRLSTPIRSVARTVSVTDSKAVLTKVTMSQFDPERPDGRKMSFDPRAGVARFPFVYVPGWEMEVEVEFDDPDRVSDVEIRVGSTRLDAERTEDDTFRVRGGFGGAGSIGVRYDSRESLD
ncbi:MAG TPA: hypothetical protein VEA78_05610, partial [Acidimicrobiales bacterium]|nr:hypothetical protein [Acidimicrobiales bacterium]